MCKAKLAATERKLVEMHAEHEVLCEMGYDDLAGLSHSLDAALLRVRQAMKDRLWATINDCHQRLMCPICLEHDPDKAPRKTLFACGHHACERCAKTLVEGSKRCHMCRAHIEVVGRFVL